eukprot:6204455-Pleurochrysis_carterae.AAC.2
MSGVGRRASGWAKPFHQPFPGFVPPFAMVPCVLQLFVNCDRHALHPLMLIIWAIFKLLMPQRSISQA